MSGGPGALGVAGKPLNYVLMRSLYMPTTMGTHAWWVIRRFAVFG